MTRSKPIRLNTWKSVQGQTLADQNKTKPGQPREISVRECWSGYWVRESWSCINQVSYGRWERTSGKWQVVRVSAMKFFIVVGGPWSRLWRLHKNFKSVVDINTYFFFCLLLVQSVFLAFQVRPSTWEPNVPSYWSALILKFAMQLLCWMSSWMPTWKSICQGPL